jgi:hypothetical protein
MTDEEQIRMPIERRAEAIRSFEIVSLDVTAGDDVAHAHHSFPQSPEG